jgi:transcriptional regulator with XRE-family HTH domain
MNPLKLFGSEIRRRRTQLGLSQEELAERCGLHRNYIGGIERGERNVALKNLLNLAYGLSTTPSELLTIFDGRRLDSIE